MVALQDRQTSKTFSGNAKPGKNRKGLAVLPPEEVQTTVFSRPHYAEQYKTRTAHLSRERTFVMATTWTCEAGFWLQARVKAIAEIVGALVSGVKSGSDVDLNNIKREVRGSPLQLCTIA